MGLFDRPNKAVANNDNNASPIHQDADEQYVLIDRLQQQTLQDTKELHDDLKPLTALLNSPFLHAALNPSSVDLYKAVRDDRIQLVTALVQSGINVDHVDEHDQNKTTLHVAARSSNSAHLPILLSHQKPATLNLVDSRGLTPLMIAAAHGNLENLQALLDAGADMEIPMDSDRLALDPLLDIDGFLTRGSTALLLAAQHGHDTIVSELVTRGADLTVETNHGFSPLIASTMNGSLACVQALLQSAQQNQVSLLSTVNDDEFTALHYAAHFGHEEVAKHLLDAGADLEATKSLEMTPLLEAVWTEEYGMVCFLISRGANLEARSDEFNDDISLFTPLMLAARFDNAEIIAALLHAGADRNAKSGDGETALEIAQARGCHNAIVALRSEST